MTETTRTATQSRARLVTDGIIGNLPEWYDFTVYGFFAATLAT